MHTRQLNRRRFIKAAVISATTLELAGSATPILGQGTNPGKNPLPRWRGFNLTDFNSPYPSSSSRRGTTDEQLNWMIDWGFDFIRLPMAYPRYVEFDR